MVEITMDELLDLVEGNPISPEKRAGSEADLDPSDGRADGEVSEDVD